MDLKTNFVDVVFYCVPFILSYLISSYLILSYLILTRWPLGSYWKNDIISPFEQNIEKLVFCYVCWSFVDKYPFRFRLSSTHWITWTFQFGRTPTLSITIRLDSNYILNFHFILGPLPNIAFPCPLTNWLMLLRHDLYVLTDDDGFSLQVLA